MSGARARAAAAGHPRVFIGLGSEVGGLVAQAWLQLVGTRSSGAIIQRAISVELAPSRHVTAERAWASVVAAGDAPRPTAAKAAGRRR